MEVQTEMTNERISKCIWSEYLQHSFKPFAWGFDYRTIKVIEAGTAFRVEGNLKGWIKIQLHPDMVTCIVSILPDDSAIPIIYQNVRLANLVETIDQVISHYRVQFQRERIAV